MKTLKLLKTVKVVLKTDSRSGSGEDDDKMWVKSAKRNMMRKILLKGLILLKRIGYK